MKRYVLTLLVPLCSFAPALGLADEATDAIRKSLAQRLPDVTVENVSPSPVPGLFEVTFDGGVIYLSQDGRYVLRGQLIDLDTREDLTERTQAKQRLHTLAQVPESRMIVYDADRKRQHTITTFTDIDCPYCRKMHREMAAMNADGIQVRYMLFPRAGFPSDSYDKAVSVWCAPDPRAAMTRAKSGETPEKRSCDNPVSEHMALARRLGLNGTPYTITDTGRVIAGYVAADDLLESLDADKQGAPR